MYTLTRSPRAKPHSVIPISSASETASEVGALTPTSTGAPATAHFCTSSNESRPLTHTSAGMQRHGAGGQARADDLVERVVAPDVLAQDDQLAGRVEQRGRVQAARALEAGLHEPVGQRGEQVARDLGAGRGRRGVDGDLLERALAAHPARRRRVEGPRARLAHERAGHLDGVAREVGGRLGPARTVDQALPEEEAQGELLVVPWRPHRDGQRPPVDADLERLLARDGVGDAVVLDLDMQGDGHDSGSLPSMRGLAGRRVLMSAVLAVVLAVVLGILILAIGAQRDAGRSARESAELVGAAAEVRGLAVDLESAERGYLITRDPSFLTPYRNALRTLPATLDRFQRLASKDPGAAARARMIRANVGAYRDRYVVPLLDVARADPAAARKLVAGGEGKRRLDELRREIARFSVAAQRVTDQRAEDANRRADAAIVTGIVGLVALLLLVGLATLYIVRNVIGPVTRVADAARGLAAGDLSSRVPRREGGTEIAELGRSFNAMASAIESQRRRLEDRGDDLAGAVETLEGEKGRMSRYLAFGREVSGQTDPAELAELVLVELSGLSGASSGAIWSVPGVDTSPAENEAPLLAVLGESNYGSPYAQPPDAGRHALEDGGEELVMPLLHGGRSVAVLALHRPERAFSPEEIERIEDLGPQAAASLTSALALRAASERESVIRAVLDSTPDAIALLDDRGRPVFENPPMRIVRRQLVESVRSPGGGYRTNIVSRGPGTEEGELRDELELPGTGQTFARYATFVSAPGGPRIGRLVVLREITRERESDRMKDEFFALVSHELRTPLTSILGYLELVLDESDALQPDHAHFLGVVQRNAARLLRLVGDLLFVAQIEAGRLALDPGAVDLERTVREAIEAARPGANAQGIALEENVKGLPITRADPDRLGQVLDNLVANAIKFTPAGGTVTVRLDGDDEVAVLEVSDTGPGIPDDEQSQLFERFFRAQSAVRDAVPGVGLGLTIVRAIVEAHGGTISVDSTAGEGATFRVRLPLRPPPAIDAQSGGSESSAAPLGGVEGRAPS